MAGDRWQYRLIDEIKAPIDGAIAIGPFGSRMKSDRYVLRGIPVIRGNNISDTRALVGEFVYVSPKTADELRSSNVFPGDLFFPHRGAIGQTGIVPGDGPERYVLSTSLMKLTCNRDLVDPVFLFYFFRSGAGRHELLKHASTVGTPGIGQPLTSLRSISVPIPPIEEQRAIARILGTLDDKIELNRRMNETLEAIARALFKSWFVDFDPVRAKCKGEPVCSPIGWVSPSGRNPPNDANGGLRGCAANPPYDLFPDSFEDSELGEIPKGWHVGKVGDLATLNREGINPGEFPEETFDHFSIPAFDEGCKPKAETGAAIKSNKFLVPPGAVLLSKLNPRIPRIWLPDLRDSHRAVCSTEFLVMLPQSGVSRDFLFCFFASDAFATVFETLVTGTSGSHQRVKPEGLLAMDAIVPKEAVIQRFTQAVKLLLERVNRAVDESRTLAALRDTLLPKLISGELRLKDAERIVERHV